MVVLVVPADRKGARLDQYLARALAERAALAQQTESSGASIGSAADSSRARAAPSRAELQRWIESGRVTVDGVVGKASSKLRVGCRIEVTPGPPAATDAVPDASVQFEILHQDDDLLVIGKPAGLVVHPARGHETGTLVNGLVARGLLVALPPPEPPGQDGLGPPPTAEEEVNDDPIAYQRPGIVHRLDKGTSGVMVVARTAAARERLKDQFSEHSIEREYEALAVGSVAAQTYATLHGRHPKDRLRFTTKVASGKRAVTHVEVVSLLAKGRASHVRCRLETGRTHQIRVHLAEDGHPIVGDPVYGRAPRDAVVREVADWLGHQALHARVLGFVHPTTGKRLRFEWPAPQDFQEGLARLSK